MKPTLGRIIHVRFEQQAGIWGRWLAAIVTEPVDDSGVFGFTAFRPPHSLKNATYSALTTTAEEGVCWRWPPRE